MYDLTSINILIIPGFSNVDSHRDLGEAAPPSWHCERHRSRQASSLYCPLHLLALETHQYRRLLGIFVVGVGRAYSYAVAGADDCH